MSFTLGQQIDFAMEFTNSSDAAADPDTVKFFLLENIDGTQLEWTYNASPVEGTDFPTGLLAMVKDSTGNYRVPYIARKPERLVGTFIGTGTIFQSQELTEFVRHSENRLVEP